MFKQMKEKVTEADFRFNEMKDELENSQKGIEDTAKELKNLNEERTRMRAKI